MKYDHPIVGNSLELPSELSSRDGKGVVFVCAPGHVDIRGNSAADSAAGDALDGNIYNERTPFSHIKTTCE